MSVALNSMQSRKLLVLSWQTGVLLLSWQPTEASKSLMHEPNYHDRQ